MAGIYVVCLPGSARIQTRALGTTTTWGAAAAGGGEAARWGGAAWGQSSPETSAAQPAITRWAKQPNRNPESTSCCSSCGHYANSLINANAFARWEWATAAGGEGAGGWGRCGGAVAAAAVAAADRWRLHFHPTHRERHPVRGALAAAAQAPGEMLLPESRGCSRSLRARQCGKQVTK